MSSRRHRTAAQGARPGGGRAGDRAGKGTWERPQVLFREPLEAVAVACVPTVDEGGPGKPDINQCASPQS